MKRLNDTPLIAPFDLTLIYALVPQASSDSLLSVQEQRNTLAVSKPREKGAMSRED
jgi:hypothetical protein